MEIDILSLFPDYFSGPFDESILKRAQAKGILKIHHVNIRDFAEDKHQRVDDRPYGGGPGMVLMAPPVSRAIRSVRRPQSRVVYLSPQGNLLTAETCQRLATYEHLILLCGHYEGVDERVLKREVDEEISIGDYVLTNGALPAIVLVDAVARFIPGVLGHALAATEDSFQAGLFDCPHYTKPEEFEGMQVPAVLLEGNHKEIDRFRKEESLKKTAEVRPDLYYAYLAKDLSSELLEQSAVVDPIDRCEIILAVDEMKKAASFYRKVLGLVPVLIEEEKTVFQAGSSKITLRKGIPYRGMGIKLVVKSEEAFKRTAVRLMHVKEQVEKLQTKSGEITFVDDNGYCWVLLLKGE